MTTAELPTPSTPSLLRDRLGEIRRKHVLVRLALGGSMVATVVLAGLGVSMILDGWLGLSFAWRGTILFALALITAWVGWRVVIRGLLATPDEDTAALLAERVIPDSQNRIISAVQLSRGQRPAGMSGALIDRLVADAHAMVEPHDLTAVIPTRGVIGWVSVAFALLTMLAGGVALTAPTGPALLLRALCVPGVQIPAATQVRLIGDDPRRVARGDRVGIDIEASGVIPEEGQARIRFDSGATSRIELTRTTAREVFQLDIDAASESFSFSITLGDGTSGPHRVQVIDPPETRAVAFTQISPAYTAREPMPRSSGDLNLLAGSSLDVAVTASKPVAAAGNHVMIHGENRAVPLYADAADPARLRPAQPLRLTPQASGLSIHLRDTLGFESRDSAVYPVRFEPDRPPVLTLVRPTEPERLVTPWARIPIRFQATDDIGVASVRLRYLVTRTRDFGLPGGDGLSLAAFANTTFSGTPAITTLATPELVLNDRSPHPSIPADNFTVRLSGFIVIPATREYQFRLVNPDDRVRVFIDDMPLLNANLHDDRTHTQRVTLTAGTHPIRIEHSEDGGVAGFVLQWNVGGSWRVIPQANLFSTDAVLAAAQSAATESAKLATPPGDTRSLDGTHLWQLTDLRLEPGDSIRWHLEAVDGNDVTGPGVGTSPTGLVLIGTAEQVRNAALARLGDYMRQIDEVEQNQQQLADDVNSIVSEPATPPPSP